MDLQTILISIFGSGGLAWVIAKMYMKSIAKEVVKENNTTLDDKYTTRECMQIERKELLEEIERRFLSIAAFREIERRIDENFKTIDRRLNESSKRFDKIDNSLQHITDLLVKERR